MSKTKQTYFDEMERLQREDEDYNKMAEENDMDWWHDLDDQEEYIFENQ